MHIQTIRKEYLSAVVALMFLPLNTTQHVYFTSSLLQLMCCNHFVYVNIDSCPKNWCAIGFSRRSLRDQKWRSGLQKQILDMLSCSSGFTFLDLLHYSGIQPSLSFKFIFAFASKNKCTMASIQVERQRQQLVLKYLLQHVTICRIVVPNDEGP